MNASTLISSCKDDEASEDKGSSQVPKGVVSIKDTVIEADRAGKQNRINNEEGDIIEKASTVSRKRLLVQTELDVRRENPVQNKFLRSARYFSRPDRKVRRKKRQKFKKKRKPCYVCADSGHRGYFCPLVNTCSVCYKKESKNDVEEEHTSMFCLKCGITGHGMFSCTNDYDPEDLKGIQCYICMKFGHLCCTENRTEGPSEASCYNCGQSGHHGFECMKMKTVANDGQQVSICFKCQERVHSPQTGELDDEPTSSETTMAGKYFVPKNSNGKSQKAQTGEMNDKSTLAVTAVARIYVPNNFVKGKSRTTQAGESDNELTSTETTTLEKDAVPKKSITGKSRKAQTRKLDNKSTSSKISTAGKDLMPNNSVKEKSQKAQTGELDDKSTSAETTMLEKDAVPNNFVKEKSRKTQAGEKVNKSASAETSMVRKDAVPDKSMKGKSRRTRRSERKRKRKPVIPTSNVIHSLPTMSNIGYTIPRYGQYYGNPVSNVWLSPPEAAARNCLANSPAINQCTYGTPGLNVWSSQPAAAARNYLEISPAVNQSSYQTGFHFFHYNTNYREATHVPPNPFRPCSLLPHERFHQGTQIPGPPQNRVHLPYQNFTHQIRTHVPRSTFDRGMGIPQPPELPHPVSNLRISALLPQQKLQHQQPSHRTWMAPGWKPNS